MADKSNPFNKFLVDIKPYKMKPLELPAFKPLKISKEKTASSTPQSSPRKRVTTAPPAEIKLPKAKGAPKVEFPTPDFTPAFPDKMSSIIDTKQRTDRLARGVQSDSGIELVDPTRPVQDAIDSAGDYKNLKVDWDSVINDYDKAVKAEEKLKGALSAKEFALKYPDYNEDSIRAAFENFGLPSKYISAEIMRQAMLLEGNNEYKYGWIEEFTKSTLDKANAAVEDGELDQPIGSDLNPNYDTPEAIKIEGPVGEWSTSIQTISAGKGIASNEMPLFLAVASAIIWGESKGNAGQLGDGGKSFGLLQLYTGGGQGNAINPETGQPYTPDELKDPTTNLSIGLPYIISAFKQAQNKGIQNPRDFLYEIMAESGHPSRSGLETDMGKAWFEQVYTAFKGYMDAVQDGGVVIDGEGKFTETSTAMTSYMNAPLAKPFDGDFGITSYFGANDVKERKGAHDGVDWGMPIGTAVKSVLPGKVVSAQPNGGYGLTVIVEHTVGDQTYTTQYSHLSQATVKVGDTIMSGGQVGLSGGATGDRTLDGTSTGPHLHLTVKDPSGRAIDPITFLQGAGHYSWQTPGSPDRQLPLITQKLIAEAAEKIANGEGTDDWRKIVQDTIIKFRQWNGGPQPFPSPTDLVNQHSGAAAEEGRKVGATPSSERQVVEGTGVNQPRSTYHAGYGIGSADYDLFGGKAPGNMEPFNPDEVNWLFKDLDRRLTPDEETKVLNTIKYGDPYLSNMYQKAYKTYVMKHVEERMAVGQSVEVPEARDINNADPLKGLLDKFYEDVLHPVQRSVGTPFFAAWENYTEELFGSTGPKDLFMFLSLLPPVAVGAATVNAIKDVVEGDADKDTFANFITGGVAGWLPGAAVAVQAARDIVTQEDDVTAFIPKPGESLPEYNTRVEDNWNRLANPAKIHEIYEAGADPFNFLNFRAYAALYAISDGPSIISGGLGALALAGPAGRGIAKADSAVGSALEAVGKLGDTKVGRIPGGRYVTRRISETPTVGQMLRGKTQQLEKTAFVHAVRKNLEKSLSKHFGSNVDTLEATPNEVRDFLRIAKTPINQLDELEPEQRYIWSLMNRVDIDDPINAKIDKILGSTDEAERMLDPNEIKKIISNDMDEGLRSRVILGEKAGIRNIPEATKAEIGRVLTLYRGKTITREEARAAIVRIKHGPIDNEEVAHILSQRMGTEYGRVGGVFNTKTAKPISRGEAIDQLMDDVANNTAVIDIVERSGGIDSGMGVHTLFDSVEKTAARIYENTADTAVQLARKRHTELVQNVFKFIDPLYIKAYKQTMYPLISATSKFILGFAGYPIGNALEDLTQAFLHGGGGAMGSNGLMNDLNIWLPGILADPNIPVAVKHAALPRDVQRAARSSLEEIYGKPTIRQRVQNAFTGRGTMDSASQAELINNASEAVRMKLKEKGLSTNLFTMSNIATKATLADMWMGIAGHVSHGIRGRFILNNYKNRIRTALQDTDYMRSLEWKNFVRAAREDMPDELTFATRGRIGDILDAASTRPDEFDSIVDQWKTLFSEPQIRKEAIQQALRGSEEWQTFSVGVQKVMYDWLGNKSLSDTVSKAKFEEFVNGSFRDALHADLIGQEVNKIPALKEAIRDELSRIRSLDIPKGEAGVETFAQHISVMHDIASRVFGAPHRVHSQYAKMVNAMPNAAESLWDSADHIIQTQWKDLIDDWLSTVQELQAKAKATGKWTDIELVSAFGDYIEIAKLNADTWAAASGPKLAPDAAGIRRARATIWEEHDRKLQGIVQGIESRGSENAYIKKFGEYIKAQDAAKINPKIRSIMHGMETMQGWSPAKTWAYVNGYLDPNGAGSIYSKAFHDRARWMQHKNKIDQIKLRKEGAGGKISTDEQRFLDEYDKWFNSTDFETRLRGEQELDTFFRRTLGSNSRYKVPKDKDIVQSHVYYEKQRDLATKEFEAVNAAENTKIVALTNGVADAEKAVFDLQSQIKALRKAAKVEDKTYAATGVEKEISALEKPVRGEPVPPPPAAPELGAVPEVTPPAELAPMPKPVATPPSSTELILRDLRLWDEFDAKRDLEERAIGELDEELDFAYDNMFERVKKDIARYKEIDDTYFRPVTIRVKGAEPITTPSPVQYDIPNRKQFEETQVDVSMAEAQAEASAAYDITATDPLNYGDLPIQRPQEGGAGQQITDLQTRLDSLTAQRDALKSNATPNIPAERTATPVETAMPQGEIDWSKLEAEAQKLQPKTIVDPNTGQTVTQYPDPSAHTGEFESKLSKFVEAQPTTPGMGLEFSVSSPEIAALDEEIGAVSKQLDDLITRSELEQKAGLVPGAIHGLPEELKITNPQLYEEYKTLEDNLIDLKMIQEDIRKEREGLVALRSSEKPVIKKVKDYERNVRIGLQRYEKRLAAHEQKFNEAQAINKKIKRSKEWKAYERGKLKQETAVLKNRRTTNKWLGEMDEYWNKYGEAIKADQQWLADWKAWVAQRRKLLPVYKAYRGALQARKIRLEELANKLEASKDAYYKLRATLSWAESTSVSKLNAAARRIEDFEQKAVNSKGWVVLDKKSGGLLTTGHETKLAAETDTIIKHNKELGEYLARSEPGSKQYTDETLGSLMNALPTPPKPSASVETVLDYYLRLTLGKDLNKSASDMAWLLTKHQAENIHQTADRTLGKVREAALKASEDPILGPDQQAKLAQYFDGVKQKYKEIPEWDKNNIRDIQKNAIGGLEEDFNEAYTQYDTANLFDNFMQHIFPFWMYETRRFKRLKATFEKNPWTLKALLQFYDATDRGYVEVGDTGYNVNPLGGTLWTAGGLLRPRPEFDKYEGFAGTLSSGLGKLGKLGIYSPVADSGIAAVAAANGDPRLMGDTFLSGSALSIPGNALTFASNPLPFTDDTRIPGVNWAAQTYSNFYNLMGDTWKPYYVNKQIASMGYDFNEVRAEAERGGKVLKPGSWGNGKDAKEILWEAEQAVAMRSATLDMFGNVLYRNPDEREFKDRDKAFFMEKFGVTSEQYDSLGPGRRSEMYEMRPDINESRKRIPGYDVWNKQFNRAFDPAESRKLQSKVDMFLRHRRNMLEGLTTQQLKDDAKLQSGDINMKHDVWVRNHATREVERANLDRTLTAPGGYYQDMPTTDEEWDNLQAQLGSSGQIKPSPIDTILKDYYSISPDEERFRLVISINGQEEQSTDWALFYRARQDFLDALPSEDMQLRQAIYYHINKNKTATEKEFEAAARAWSKYKEIPKFEGMTHEEAEEYDRDQKYIADVTTYLKQFKSQMDIEKFTELSLKIHKLEMKWSGKRPVTSNARKKYMYTDEGKLMTVWFRMEAINGPGTVYDPLNERKLK